MECDFIILPLPRFLPDDVLKKIAKKIVKKRIQYLKGTMALENQRPEEKWTEEMLETEVQELLRNPSKIWREDVR